MSTTPPPPPPGPPPGGQYPPPPGPPPGGYPPPPGGGWGAPPPGAGSPRWDLGAALSYGWNKLTANFWQVILAVGILLLAMTAIYVVMGLLVAVFTSGPHVDRETGQWDDGTPFVMRTLLQVALSFVGAIPSYLLGLAAIRAVLDLVETGTLQVNQMFTRIPWGQGLLAAFLVSLGTSVGTLLCYLPGLAFALFAMFTQFFVVDKQMSAIDAIKASFTLVKDNFGNALVWAIVGGLIAIAGFCVCYVGGFVTVPLVMIGTAFTYKVFTHQPVAA